MGCISTGIGVLFVLLYWINPVDLAPGPVDDLMVTGLTVLAVKLWNNLWLSLKVMNIFTRFAVVFLLLLLTIGLAIGYLTSNAKLVDFSIEGQQTLARGVNQNLGATTDKILNSNGVSERISDITNQGLEVVEDSLVVINEKAPVVLTNIIEGVGERIGAIIDQILEIIETSLEEITSG